MAISLKHNLKVKKGNIHPGTFYVNKTHIYSILVIVQGVKHGMKFLHNRIMHSENSVLIRNIRLYLDLVTVVKMIMELIRDTYTVT